MTIFFTARVGLVVASCAVVLSASPLMAQGSQGSSKALSAQAHANQPASAQSSGAGTPNALQGFSQNQGKPIHIDAAKLEVRDKDKLATFSGDTKTGDVKVVQGDTVMRSKTLVVFYEQSAGVAQKDKAVPAASPGPGGSQQIRRLEARGSVIVTQSDQTVTGETGIFDTRANTVTMQGNVILTQGKNVMKGQTLVVDLTTGVSRLENGGGRVDMILFPQSGQQPGSPGGSGNAPASSGGGGKPMILNGIGGGQGR
jgi:lipopolysaccharide export system protein LptA